jgi:hypothetical protein
MNKLLITFLVFFITQTFACEIPKEKFRVFTESEWSVYLEIENNNVFTVTWGAYISGQPDSLETKSYKGKWSCRNGIYTFVYELETAKGQYQKSEKYPLGIFKNKKALIFSGNQENGKYLSGYSFWPINE